MGKLEITGQTLSILWLVSLSYGIVCWVSADAAKGLGGFLGVWLWSAVWWVTFLTLQTLGVRF